MLQMLAVCTLFWLLGQMDGLGVPYMLVAQRAG